MNVVVFSGTTEGRSFSRALAALGAAVTVCVATELGAEEQGCADGITVRTGRLDAEGMAALLRGAALCVDATHPYAAEATHNIRAAAAAAGVEYHRLLRPASALPAGSVVLADCRPGRRVSGRQTGAASCWRRVPRSCPPLQRWTRRGSTRACCLRWRVSQPARQRAFRTAISLRCRGLLREN